MGIYEDMANDAGCAYGTSENQQMAQSIERQDYDRMIENQYYEQFEFEIEFEKERKHRILFHKFTCIDSWLPDF